MQRRVAILVKRFPKLSETFILGEITSLIDSGVDLVIFSIDRPNELKRQPEAQKLAADVRYLCSVGWSECVKKIMHSFFRHPIKTSKMLIAAVFNGASLKSLLALLWACDAHRIDHIHAHYISMPALLSELVATINGASFSVSAHAKDIYTTDPKFISRRIAAAEFVATCTAYNAQFLRDLAPQCAERIHLIYHGVDVENFSPALHSLAQENPLILAIGRFKEKKGFDLLIDACSLLVKQGIRLRCEIVGYGDLKAQLAEQIRTSGVAHCVTLRDPVDHSELAAVLRRASVFVLPCRVPDDGDRDGIPNSILEAMACGIPVVSTTISGIPEVIEHGANGFLVAPDDAVKLADAIRDLLADTNLSLELGRMARRTVSSQFSWHHNIQALCDIIDVPRQAKPALEA
jgi:glycosyltransferase involved in cell wall biosynthesis